MALLLLLRSRLPLPLVLMLSVALVAPDGTAYPLKTTSPTDSTANVSTTYSANLAGETADGIWQLRVQDAYASDTGYLNSWTLTV